MTSIDIETLPELVRTKKMSVKEAVDIIWAKIYTRPATYGLGLLDEDSKSDFLLYLQTKFEHLFENFTPGRAKFNSYLRTFLKFSYYTWIRKKENIPTRDMDYSYIFNELYTLDSQRYAEQETTEQSDLKIFQKQFAELKTRRLAENTALILTLKNCHHIDESILQNVSKFINMDIEKLRRLVNKFKAQCNDKMQQRERVIRRRDNAFYYHRKYMLELQKHEKGSATFEAVEKKYLQQTENWIKQNELLGHRYVLSPTNNSIAKELGIKPRKVSFYINYAMRTRNPFENDNDDHEEPQDSE